MARKILISSGSIKVEATLNDTKTAEAIWAALPITGQANRWGDEIYFEIPVRLAAENGKALVDAGDLGYWPPGRAFCIFFGPTPISREDEIRAASPVNVLGKVDGNPEVLRKVKDGKEIIVSAR